MQNHILPHRRSIRFKGYDYSLPGAYFVTITCWQGNRLFGEIVSDEMHMNSLGELAAHRLLSLPQFFPVQLDAWVIMPNHLHFILILDDPGTGEASAHSHELTDKDSADASPLPNGTKRRSLGAIIQNYKSTTARQINALRGTPGASIWHRNYFERIIRNEQEMERIHLYIVNNPQNWLKDPENLRRW